MKGSVNKQMAALLVLAVMGSAALAQQEVPPEGVDRPARGADDGGRLEEMALISPEELEGVTVVDEGGNEVGQVQRVVLKRGSSEVYLILSSDTFLGLGAEDVVVSVEDLSIEGDDHVRLRSQDSVELYDPANFLEIEVAG